MALGPKTDELKAVKDELDETEQELEQAERSVWKQRAQAMAIVIGALATLATAILAHFRPETVAEETAGAAAVQLRQLQAVIAEQDRALQGAQAACKRSSELAAAKSKAEADSVRTLLLGYLLAQSRAPARGRGGQINQALAKVVKELGEHKATRGLRPMLRRSNPPMPTKRKIKLAPPSRLEQLSKGAK